MDGNGNGNNSPAIVTDDDNAAQPSRNNPRARAFVTPSKKKKARKFRHNELLVQCMFPNSLQTPNGPCVGCGRQVTVRNVYLHCPICDKKYCCKCDQKGKFEIPYECTTCGNHVCDECAPRCKICHQSDCQTCFYSHECDEL